VEQAAPAVREALERALVDDGDRLYALALRVTRDPDLAADAVQDAFATALERSQQFRGESAASTWLYRIVYNKAIDRLRERRRDEPRTDDEDETPDETEPASGGAWSRPPDEVLAGAETRAAIDRAVAELTPVQRAIFELREYEGRPTEQIAQIVGLPVGTVRVYLHRARLRLRRLLADAFGGGRR
jgi:RNA polymerase sigma-70 factor (ECF subfamily)